MDDKQKRVLAIGGVGVGGLLVYRHLHSGKTVTRSSGLTNGLAQASSGATGSTVPFVPQSPIVVPPGESIYDPNSQALLNTPSTTPPQAVTPSGPAYVVNVAPPKTHATRRNTRRAATRRVAAKTNQQHKARRKKKAVAK